MNLVKVMVFGTFDGLHDGHRDFFQQALSYGEHLVVVVSRDAAIAHTYGENPEYDEVDRIAAILGEGIAKDVVMGHLDGKEKVIVEHEPNTIVLGYSQKPLQSALYDKVRALGLGEINIKIAKEFNSDDYPPSGFDKASVHVD